MKRKFFSTLLFGALACATLGTVTSCKDYDDDISNLQEQIDKKAALDKVNDLVTQVTNAENQAKSAYDLAASKASQADVEAAKTAAVDAAKKAAQEIADAASKDAQSAADAAKKAQETADQAVKDAGDVAAKLKDYVLASELKTQLEDLKKELEEGSIKELTDKVKGYDNAINALYSAVTEVSLVGSFTDGTFKTAVAGGESPFDLAFMTGKTGSSDFIFGKNQKDDTDKNATDANEPYKYAKNTQIDFPKTIVVRINPTNAVITPEMIKFIDSKGNDLNKVIKVKSVEKYDGLLTRAASNTGLWTVELGLADGAQAKNVEQKKGDNHILYAMAVNNTADQAEAASNAADRYVVSTYDITLQACTTYAGANDASDEVLGSVQLKSATQQPTWTNLSSLNYRGSSCFRTSNELPDLLAANGETISIRFNTSDQPKLANVDRFYVVRDDNHAEVNSSPSEINVWKTYQYTGLGEMVEVKNGTGIGEMSITIPSNLATGDQIAFRLFAVNYDGTLVCETGESFCVTVVNTQTTASVAGEIVATSEYPSTEWLPITGTLKDTGTLPESVNVLVGNTTFALTVQYATDANGSAASKNSEVKYAKFTLPASVVNGIKDWTDDAVGTGNITTTGTNGEIVNNIAVSLTKKLPTSNVKDYTWKPNQLVDGTYTAYLFPDGDTEANAKWTTYPATYGKQDMNAVITGLVNGDIFTIDGIKVNGKNVYTDANSFSDDVISIPVAADANGTELIDNKTPHKMTISHDYGEVSSKTKDHVLVAYETVNVIFADPLAKPWQTLEWADIKTGTDKDGNAIYAKGNYLTYGESKTLQDTPFLALIKATNHFDNTKFGGSLKNLLQGDKSTSFNAKYQSLVSVTDKSNYFKFEINDGKTGISKITPVITSNPTADVTTTLEIVLKTAFGTTCTYELPFTVKRAE